MHDIAALLKRVSGMDWLFIAIYAIATVTMCLTGHEDAAAWVFAAGYTYITPQYYMYMKEIKSKNK